MTCSKDTIHGRTMSRGTGVTSKGKGNIMEVRRKDTMHIKSQEEDRNEQEKRKKRSN